MKYLNILFIASITIVTFSCKDNKNTEPEVVNVDTSEIKVEEAATTESSFKDEKVAKVFEQYLDVKNALVATDAKKTAEAANALKMTIIEFDADKKAEAALSEMASSGDIEEQRTYFVALTASMDTILNGALASGTIFKQYCPMAFNNEGASWFSNSKEIRNPYFGDKMLKCGRVEAELN